MNIPYCWIIQFHLSKLKNIVALVIAKDKSKSVIIQPTRLSWVESKLSVEMVTNATLNMKHIDFVQVSDILNHVANVLILNRGYDCSTMET